MSGKIRRKLASSISVIQEGEDFLYNSTIRTPANNSVAIGNISYSNILDTSYLTFGFDKPYLSKPFFKLDNSSLFPEDLNYLFVKKVKTNTVFFQLLYVPSRITLHRDIEPKPSGAPAQRIDFQMKKEASLDVAVKLAEPEIKDYLQNLKAKVEKIELLKMEDVHSEGNDTVIEEINVKEFKNVTREINVRSFGKLKVKKIKSDGIKKIPKLNKIEVPGVGKYKAKISTINFSQLNIVAISKSPMLDFILPSVSSPELSFSSIDTINCDTAHVQYITKAPSEIVDEMNELVDVSEPQDIVDNIDEPVNVSEPQDIVDELDEMEIVSEPQEIVDEIDEMEIVSEPQEIVDEIDETEIVSELQEIVDEIDTPEIVSEPQEIVDEIDETEIVSEPQETVDEIDKPEIVSEPVKLVLKTSHKVEWETRQDPEIILNEYEDKNARFLVENNRAFLAEEPGLNKIKESIAALKFLFQNRFINSTLVVLPAGILGHSEKAKQLGVSNGWIGNLEKFCSDMSYSVIRGNDNERHDAWSKSANIHIVDHKTFLNDHSSNILEKQRFTNFDCVIIDEVQELLDSSDKSESVLEEINSDIFWILSSIVGDNILSLLNEHLNDNCKIEERKVRFLTDADEEDAVINDEEFWLEPNERQRIEYKENFIECRKELKKVLESGNPFRYQSNIFTLVHKLYQVQNFTQDNDTSPKSDLLIQHVKAIEKNLKKVIVISQYDRQGTKKIEQLFDQHKINYITVPTSLSGEEIEKAVSLFKSRKSITVFLTNAKISRLDFKDFIVPYIIRFDSWWNPALLWQTKNLFDISKSNSEKNVVNVFTYKMLDTIAELIKRVLISKNYMDDNIISAMPPTAINDLIVIDDWLKIFDMPVDDENEILQKLYEETVENLHNLSLRDYRDTLIRFFFTIGYANAKINEDKNSESFDISGKGKSGNQIVHLTCKVLSDEIITRENLKLIISDISLAQKNNTFIITRGNFEKGCSEIAKNKVTLLDVEKLAAYLVNLQLVQPSTERQAE
jgi:hypothetical protein